MPSSPNSEHDHVEVEHSFTIPTHDVLRHSIITDSEPIAKRMRTVFLLKQLADAEAISILLLGLQASSVLLGHECAYALGQLQNALAYEPLTIAAQNVALDPIVRHECVEALANIAEQDVALTRGALPLLELLCQNDCSEVRDTAEIARDKLVRKLSQLDAHASLPQTAFYADTPQSKYHSVDPAPPIASHSVEEMRIMLNDRSLSLYQRYRAMFTLRNIGSDEAILALASATDGGAESDSPVFRHEIAYVLGQIASPIALQCLTTLLNSKHEHAMVRHEAAEAIGAIAEEQSESMLHTYVTNDQEDVIVQESCNVALDLVDYWNNDETSTALETATDGEHKEAEHKQSDSKAEKAASLVSTDDIVATPFKRFVRPAATTK